MRSLQASTKHAAAGATADKPSIGSAGHARVSPDVVGVHRQLMRFAKTHLRTTSEQFDVTEHGAGVLLHRARNRLRTMLSQEWPMRAD